MMRLLVLCSVVFVWIFCGLEVSGQEKKGQEKKAPATLTFKSKNGNVTFNHAAHVKREKNNCAECHPKLFPQSATAPLNFKAAMHKTAETAHTSCGFCHHPGGKSFGVTGNCAKCHQKS
jgi:c(7)-type cytochrome triheme protein